MVAVRSIRRRVESSDATDMWERIRRMVESPSEESAALTTLATGETGTLERLFGLYEIRLLPLNPDCLEDATDTISSTVSSILTVLRLIRLPALLDATLVSELEVVVLSNPLLGTLILPEE